MIDREDISDWDAAQDDDDDFTDSPEELADPSCVECGGHGGFLTTDGETWVWCRCIDDRDEGADDR